MIVFTSDIDWANEEIIADVISLFDKYGVKCTFFSTHHSPLLSKTDKKQFEIGIHPNFNPIFSGKTKKRPIDIIDELLDIHPEAKGVRSHAILQSTNIIQLFAERNLIYDSNIFLPYEHNIKAFKLWNGFVRIPYNWEDEVHWSYGYQFDESQMNLNNESLCIFNFHPIHIYLNTENKYRFKIAKIYYDDPIKLLEYRNFEILGARDMLISLLEYIKINKIETYRMIDLAWDILKKDLK